MQNFGVSLNLPAVRVIWTVILFFLCLGTQAQSIPVELRGLESFDFKNSKTVKDSLGLKRLAKDILEQLFEESYLAARLDNMEYGENPKLYFDVGNQYKWVQLRRGNLEEELVNKIDLSNRLFLNRPFSGKNLRLLYKRSINYFENHGYPFAQVALDSIRISPEGEISAALLIEKNQFYKVDSVLLKGNSGISKNYLLRHLGLKEGQPYHEANIAAISTRIREIPFIKESQEHQVQFFEEGVKIIMRTEKQKASRFDGVLGLLSNEQDGKIELTGDVDLNLINAFNRGEAIGLNWRKLKGNSQDLETDFAYPYFLNSALGIDFNFKLFKRDTTFIDLTTRLGINYNLRRAEFIRLFVQNKRSNLLSRKSLVAQTSGSIPRIGDVRINMFGVGYRLERLNYKYNPSSGFRVNSSFAVGRKELIKIRALEEEDPDIYQDVELKTNQFNGDIQVQKFFKIKNRSTILIANQSASTYSDNLYFNELLRIGGLKLLRGFDEESINVSSYSIFTLEYRFLLDRNSFFSLFSDGGYYEVAYLDFFEKDTPIGFGAGLSFETKAGIFTINYAVGKQFDNPIDLRAAKVHFGFINFF